MIANNPYNLPDKILKPNLVSKPINLQSKKSRDKSNQLYKEFSNKGIKIETQMKKSLTIQHITSSPNLHSISTSNSARSPIQFQSVNRSNQHHQTPIMLSNQSQNDKKIKFLFQKFYLMSQQIINHENVLSRISQEKEKNERNSWQSSYESQKQNKQENKNSSRSFHTNHTSNGSNLSQSGGLSPVNDNTIFTLQLIKKQISNMKQQIQVIRTAASNSNKQQSINLGSNSKSVKLSTNTSISNEYENISSPRQKMPNSSNQSNMSMSPAKIHQLFKNNQQFLQQFKLSIQEKYNKIENNLHRLEGNSSKVEGNFQLLSHKINKNQQKVQTLQTNIQKHMNLVNQQINSALSKIVSSINEKISKALENNVLTINQKMKKSLDACKGLVQQNRGEVQLTMNQKLMKWQERFQKIESQQKLLSNTSFLSSENNLNKITQTHNHKDSIISLEVINKLKQTITNDLRQNFLNNTKKQTLFSNTSTTFSLKPSCFKSISPSFLKLNITSTIAKHSFAKSQNLFATFQPQNKHNEIILQSLTYYLDKQGYLIDENGYYLIDQNQMIIQICEDKMVRLKEEGLIQG